MSKILKNQTASAIVISDTGVTVSASGEHTIDPNKYLLWAASDDVITEVGAGNIVVNDGSVDLGVSDGIDLVKGVFTKFILEDTDGNSAAINDNNQLEIALAANTEAQRETINMLNKIIKELRINNLHQEVLSDEEFTKKDL